MKIGFTGTHGTGKTTIVDLLRKDPQFYKYAFSSNFSRQLVAQGVPINDKCTFEGQQKFMHKRYEEIGANKHVICDRTSYDVLAYTLNSKSDITQAGKWIMECYHKELYKDYDVIFYFPIEFVMEKDGVRKVDEKYRKKIDKTIQELLLKYPPRKIITMNGEVKERLKLLKSTIKGGIK